MPDGLLLSTVFGVCIENLLCFPLFFLGFPRRKFFAARFFPLTVLAVCALCLFSQTLPPTNLSVFLYYLVQFGVLTALFHFCFQTSWEQALYSASAGRATQHLISSVLNLVNLNAEDLFAWLPGGMWRYFLRTALFYAVFCPLIYFAFARNMDTSHYEKNDFRRQMNLLSAGMLLICIGITRFAKSMDAWDRNAFIAQNLYAVTCCLLCLIIQFELCKRATLTKEMEMVRMLWKEDSKQLAERKDTIELINMKCHDIRHRLEDYRLPLTGGEQSELESLIRIYDQSYRTGSQTLDVLLADRAMLCEKNHIQLSFLGDGGCLRFLTEPEIYSLFGNALSNAVEASCGVEEDRRQISVIIRTSGDLISINITNYYRGALRFEDGLPVTTRPDPRDLHGYGMKSMRTIARKYGGELRVKAGDGVFVLTVWLVNSGARQDQSSDYTN